MRMEVDVTGTGSCSMAGCRVIGVEDSGVVAGVELK